MFALIEKKRDNPHHPAFCKILALHMVFVSNKNHLLMGLFVSIKFVIIGVPIT